MLGKGRRIRRRGQHGCALVFQGKIWRGKQSCCVSKYSICADWQNSHPRPRAFPSPPRTPAPASAERNQTGGRRSTQHGGEGLGWEPRAASRDLRVPQVSQPPWCRAGAMHTWASHGAGIGSVGTGVGTGSDRVL